MRKTSNISENSSDWEDLPGFKNNLKNKQATDNDMQKVELCSNSLDLSSKEIKETEEKKETKENHKSTTPSSCDKESCLICMERMREIVFIPCSHFLTCPLCAPKLINCPMCNKRILKHLKIYWC